MKLLVILILFTASAIAYTHIEKSGNKCPPGYSDTNGNYCISYSDEPKQVLTKTGGKCPPVWSNTKGNYCVNNRKERDDVIVKSGVRHRGRLSRRISPGQLPPHYVPGTDRRIPRRGVAVTRGRMIV